MTYRAIRYESADHVGWLTLNRPEALNAYTTVMCDEIVDVLTRYQADDDIRVLVITGEGRAFCAGGDVRNTDEVDEAERRQLGHAMVMREGMHRVGRLLHGLDKPTIAMVNGVAVAGGLTLALLCDLRVAGASARLGDTSGRVGLLPDEGGAWLFPRAMGMEAALRMTLLGEIYDAERARELGLVGEVVPDEKLREHTAELAAVLAAKAPLAVRVAKKLMLRAAGTSFDHALGDAEFAVDVVNNSADVAEGVAAFVEKRPPRFEGR
ncbi:MAG: enoyl-CoA hydratase/isomerase family protein [Pseudonocardia sp.]|uniref:enoyl-CoA hydratase/isomerase family protein n=1 Tax=unclassified Pseudonocardia TaxID=2619320 RepID=UPI00086E8E12|nr:MULTISPECIES: enoyl-CoA hydratase-related protein [unclassified Pseudonocardia]MBN9112296.1 enoyl-CoA hydratase/isomerase family protein [Pseudonocardia sp.]ODU24128.1 MAG: enoyl-CoA hydratase [Pseudonocardia sp. SCN 72-51]ODV01029.1 MAG: enoyl-CoA hydratase [Pseudonocardia sp. SCN 73-27]